jgi:hypothetical protein
VTTARHEWFCAAGVLALSRTLQDRIPNTMGTAVARLQRQASTLREARIDQQT